jgi:predicted ATP-binding protein involved in virulence
MRIKELKLRNFRGIKNLDLVFNQEYNIVVLVGINGIGKSSILDCINLLVQYYGKVSHEYHSLNIPSYEKISNRQGLLESDIHIQCDYTNIRLIDTNNVDWKLTRSNNYNDEDDGLEYLEEGINEDSIKNITKDGCTNLEDRYFYYLANRQIVDFHGVGTTKSKNIINFESFSKWFKETEDLENEQRLSDKIEYRHPILESVRSSVYSMLGEEYSNLTFKRAVDRMTVKKSGQEIAVRLLSDGEKNLLAMVGHLSRRLAEEYDRFENKLNDSSIVLIDEIELHLHPEWQRMIIPRLTKTFPNCQFIVTTHSPQVLSHVAPECIHILDYDGDNVIVKRPESSYGLDSNRILEDILGVSKRPKEIQERMLELFRTINNNDLASAKEIVQELGDRIGINEPELVKAEATIKRREIIGR